MTPKVTFVVPCYNLAYLLPECINSILAQTFEDFEILIMDDASPDDTPTVAQSFRDPRVTHIRNDRNLGHLRNYNKGIGLAQGRYVWLISADDVIRRSNALERYVTFFEQHPLVGYVFSCGTGLKDGKETGLITDFSWGSSDRVFDGLEFLSKLLARGGGILAPSCMVRKECYERVSLFPSDMPHQADLYLWCVWALHYDVAYFAESNVAYRLHDRSMMSIIKRTNPVRIVEDQLEIQWRVKREATRLGKSSTVKTWLSRVASLYSYCLVSQRFHSSPYRMTFDEFERSLSQHAVDATEEMRVRARVLAGYADGCYWHGEPGEARDYYRRGLKVDVAMPKVWAKSMLLRMGDLGTWIRERFQVVKTQADVEQPDL